MGNDSRASMSCASLAAALAFTLVLFSAEVCRVFPSHLVAAAAAATSSQRAAAAAAVAPLGRLAVAPGCQANLGRQANTYSD